MTTSKLRWRCRRGTKELDDVLLRFLEEGYAGLDEAAQRAFADLLEQQDPDLARWLLAGDEPPAQWRAVVDRIRRGVGDW